MLYFCSCIYIAGYHEEYKYCTLEQQIIYPLFLPSGAWSIATIKVVLRAENGIHRATICNESYRPHEKETEACLLLCIVLNTEKYAHLTCS